MCELTLTNLLFTVARLFISAAAVLSCAVLAVAQQLPLKIYSVGQGLGSNNVYHSYQDRKGFLWFATGEGVSLFDGYEFRNFDNRDGLPSTATIVVTEDNAGRIWIGTFDGVSRQRMNDGPSDRGGVTFETFRLTGNATLKEKVSNQVRRILFEPSGTMWLLTDHGLFKSTNPEAPEPVFETVIDRDMAWSSGAHRDADGTIWFGLGDELYEIRNSEVIARGSVGVRFPQNLITGITRDREGNLLVSDIANLFEYRAPTDSSANAVFEKIFSTPKGTSPSDVVVTADGSIWVGTDKGLYRRSGDRTTGFSAFGVPPMTTIRGLSTDRDDNLWISILNQGVGLLQTESLLNFIPKDRTNKSVGDLIEDANGRLWAALDDFAPAIIENNALAERELADAFPANPSAWFGNDGKSWLFAVGNQAFRVNRPLLRLRNGRIIDVEEMIDNRVQGNRFFEDANGILWIAKRDGKVYRGVPVSSDQFDFETIPTESPFSFFASRIESDGAGGVWLFHPLFTGRIRNGVYQPVPISDGLPEKEARSVFTDRRGWLWVGTRNRGVSMTKSPGADNPEFINYSKANAVLRSNAVRSITEDRAGRLYFATDNGLSRFDLEKNEWRYYASASGLAGDVVFGVYRDRRGFVWAATEGGASRIDPDGGKDDAVQAKIYLTGIQVAGTTVSLPVTGATELRNVAYEYNQNDLTITYVAPNNGDPTLQYQYRLGDDEWSRPTRERSVTFSNLSAGDYRFSVRALTGGGTVTSEPAVFEFEINPPFWQEIWFICAVVALVIGLIYLAFRARVRHLLELERTRTRIATDLHDDIGTNLSKISLLSGLVRMQSAPVVDSETSRMLNIIGETSRESVGAMTDIVWAINPSKDSVGDLVRRMRRHAEETFIDRNVELSFVDSGDNIKLPMEIRRDVYLIFKEAINNAAKHSGCRTLRIQFGVEGRELSLIISDDGCGFDPDSPGEGNGVANLRARAGRIGARLDILSANGSGTVVRLSMRI